MDPVGQWSAYAASYNRLANAGGFQNPPSNDLHHHMGGCVQTAPSTTSQLLAAHATSNLAGSAASPYNPTGFLSPPPVGYDSVFPPLFHQKAHYGIQHRPLKQSETDVYNQMAPNNYFEQNNTSALAWSQNNAQLPSPFGILPHESVVPNSSVVSTKTYENFNAHFAAAQTLNQLNSQISDYKSTPFIDPSYKKHSLSPIAKATASTPFFQQSFVSSEPNFNFKQNDYTVKNFHNGNFPQTCGISPAISQSKEHRLSQPIRPQFPQQRIEKPNFTTPKQNVQKVPHKIYENEKRTEHDSQSSPISFAMMDSQRNYQTTKLRNQQFQNIPNQQSYRFPMTPESDYQRSKSTESFGSTSSNPDCNIGLPRRPSPLQAHTSPNNAPSPVYPMYNSPLTTISSPSPVQNEPCFNKHNDITPPLDVSVSRNSSLYSSVITRTDIRFDRQDYNRQPWDDRQRRHPSYENTNGHSRQQYFDPTHQVSLQDLSSCRGDPMSLVKTLQQQQPEKVLEDKSKKRCKSIDNSSETDGFVRVPPPAHHNTNQSNQNGYFDSERWNLAPPAKIFPSSPVTYSTQPTIGTNFSNQHQSLMVPHPGMPLPYFPSVPYSHQSQSPEESVNTVIEPIQTNVIVPNIEDELRCLLDDNDVESLRPKITLPLNPGKNFMSSFVKYIHGEKESSPPPNLRPVRRMVKPKIYQKIESKENEPLSVIQATFPEFPSDPQDDPRYFPLPKSSDKRSFDSSDSDDNIFTFNSKIDKKVETPPPTPPVVKESPISKEEKVELGTKKKKRKKDMIKKCRKPKNKADIEILLPRRETAKRKAKELSIPLLDDDIELENHIPELQSSDSDPAWVPCEKVLTDKKKVKKIRLPKRQTKTLISIESTDDEDVPFADRAKKKTKRKNNGHKKRKTKQTFPLIITPSRLSGSKSNQFPFNVGEFVVLKTDLPLRHPPLWRVKEKTILQKFQHFMKNGIPHHQNLPCYTGWSPESKNVYEGVTVKVLSMTKHDMVVQLLSTDIQDMTQQERNNIETAMELTLKYQDNFEVYVQTLFSQALDSNFLIEIFQEEDEYFLSNVRAVDGYVNDLREKLVNVLGWNESFISTVDTYSSYKSYPRNGTNCQCGADGLCQFVLSGIAYNKDTLQQKGDTVITVDAVLCKDCLSKAEVLHKLCHFKCSLYAVCEEKVEEKRKSEPNKDTTVVLNDLLADDVWLSQIFRNIRKEWGYTELVIEKFRKMLAL